MTSEINKALAAALQRLLRPLVRLLLRHGISHTEFSELAKQVYVDVADREFPLPGRKQSVSRISVLTGLTRKEVSRLQKLGLEDDAPQAEQVKVLVFAMAQTCPRLRRASSPYRVRVRSVSQVRAMPDRMQAVNR